MYILSQFPYPSGDLHLGHARVYYIGDSLSAYYRLKNYKVIYPIGWDSFGLPAENAAIIHGKNPKQWTEQNITKMKEQLKHLNINFNWEMELSTSTPQYYRWTQQIFIKMFKKGLAYKKMAEVNWDPIDQTVLANQQVDQNGCSWRSGAKVQKKMLNQWFLKITDYAEELVSGLDHLNWITKVKNMQKGWIGLKKGYKIQFQCQTDQQKQSKIEVFVQDLQALKTAKFIIRKLQNTDSQDNNILKDKVYGKAINPYDKNKIIVIHCPKEESASYSLVCQKDIKTNQHYRDIFNKHVKSQNKNKNKNLKNDQPSIINKEDIFKLETKYEEIKLKDWLISRQRFWGCPIPIINCQKCGSIPIEQSKLPVILPEWKNTGNPLLKEQFKKCKCPRCGNQDAERETDTMDTFVDSSWYYLRFMDNFNKQRIFQVSKIKQMMPVDIYIGGIEHAIMHLLYARFIMRFIQKEYELSEQCIEPFKELVVQGMVKGKTFTLKQNGKYISLKDIQNGKYRIEDVNITYQKMSKSKFNGLNPNILVDRFGSDALRTSIFFANPPDRDIDFSEQIVANSEKFLKRVQNLWKQLSLLKNQDLKQTNNNELLPKEQLLKLKTIFEKMQISIQKRLMHTYVANVMEMFNLIKQFVQIGNKQICNENKVKLFAVFVRILGIIAPQLSKNLQQNLLGKFKEILREEEFERWPCDEIFGESVQVLIMRGKKMIGKDTVDVRVSDEEMIKVLKIQGRVQEIKRQKKKFIVILQ